MLGSNEGAIHMVLSIPTHPDLEMNIGNHSKSLFFLAAFSAALGLMLAGRVTAQTFTILHGFAGGASPYAGLVLSGKVLYGTTSDGGSSGGGTVFAVNANGTGFTNLYNCTALSGPSPGTNSDGAYPYGALMLSGNTLYGTTFQGGSSGGGTVFAVNINGTSFTNPHIFTALSGPFPGTNSDGAYPSAGLILSGSTLYGTALSGGSAGAGTVFTLNTDGTGFTNLYSFAAAARNAGTGWATNSDGGNPYGRLTLSGNTLYGTAIGSGTLGGGTVFRVNTDGTGFTNLHNFTAFPFDTLWPTNSDGASPYAGLVLWGNTLYGTTSQGGSSGGGTVFAVSADGTGFTNLHTLEGWDGGGPHGALILSGNTLYGTANYDGCSHQNGTVFAINTDGTGFMTLHCFAFGEGGALRVTL
jgi:uncharacterized repeat protein (TIGR03803 family)